MIICFLIPLSTVSASDINNTADNQVLSATPNVDTISANVNNGEQDNDTLSVQNDEKNILSAGINDNSGSNTILKAGEEYASFTELNQILALITSDEFKFTKNYRYNPTTDGLYVNGIIIPEHIKTIDGNGFTVDGIDQAYLFDSVRVNGFTIKNLNAINIKQIIRQQVTFDNFTLTNSNVTGFSVSLDFESNDIHISKMNISSGSSVLFYFISCKNITLEDSSFSDITLSNSQGLIYFRTGAVNSVVKNCNFTNIYVYQQWSGSPIYCQRSSISIYDCRIINCKNRGDAGQGLNSKAYGFLGDPTQVIGERIYIENYDGYSLLLSPLCNIRNITIIGGSLREGFQKLYGGSILDGLKVYNTTFNYPVIKLGINGFVKNSLFYNCSFPISTVNEFGVVENTDFINCTTSQISLIMINNDRNSFIDCTFDNTTSTSTSEYAANAIYTNNKTIKIQNPIFKNMPNNLPNITGEIIDYISYDDIYVDESAPDTGNGSIDNPTNNLTWAINNINPLGTIHIYAGTYNLNGTSQSIRGSLIGEEENVIIKNSSITSSTASINVKNILFDDVSLNIVKNTRIEDCNFTNVNRTVNVLWSGTQSEGSNTIINNIRIYNVNATRALRFSEHVVIKNIVVEDSNFTMGVISGDYRGNDWTVEGFTIKNVSCGDMITLPSNQALIGSVKNINVTNCTLSSLIRDPDNAFTKYVFDNITLKNSTIKNTTGYLIPLKSDCSYNDIHINDVNCNGVSIFKAVNNNANVSNSDFTNITIDGFLVNGDYNVILDNVSIERSMLCSTVEYPKSNSIYHNLTVKGVSFSSDVSLYLYDGMILDNAYFENYTGHIMVEGMNVVFDNSCFINGSNDHLNGGVAFVSGAGFKVRNSIFKSNNATYGGGFYFNSVAYKPSFISCTFNDNRANDTIGSGGAIYLLGESVYLGLDAFTNNTINKENNWYNNYFGNISQLYTGYVYVVYNESDWGSSDGSGSSPENAASFSRVLPGIGSDCYIIFVNTTEKYNQSNLYINSIELIDVNNVTFEGYNTIFDNVPFVIKDSATDIAIYNITFSNNAANSIIWNSENGKINNCIFTSNTANDQGTVFVNASGLNIINSKFTGNKLTNSKGHGGALYINASDIIVEKSIFSNNSVEDTGNHIYIESDLNNIIIFNNTFNVSSVNVGSGAAIFAQGTNVNITENNFNDLNGTIGSALHIYGDIGFFNLINNTFSGNNAENGILYLYFTNKYGVENNIKNNMFTGNNATLGGAVYMDVIDNTLFTFENNNFTGNNATCGGAIFINNPVIVLNNTYEKNNATQGGAVYIAGDNVVLNDGNFTGNNATQGGAVYIAGDNVVLNDGIFTGNNATLGGALYVAGDKAHVNDCDFIANTANKTESYGSAIYIEDNRNFYGDNIYLDRNYVRGEDGYLQRADISFGNIVPGITQFRPTSDPYLQYMSNRTDNFTYTFVYVSMIERGFGFTPENATSWDRALNGINPDGIIFIVDRDFFVNEIMIQKLRDANLTNVSIVGYNKTTVKRNESYTDKYLFILLNNNIIKLKIIHLIHHIKNV